MIQLTPQSRIFVAVEPVDFRKGIEGLAAVCRHRLADNQVPSGVDSGLVEEPASGPVAGGAGATAGGAAGAVAVRAVWVAVTVAPRGTPALRRRPTRLRRKPTRLRYPPALTLRKRPPHRTPGKRNPDDFVCGCSYSCSNSLFERPPRGVAVDSDFRNRS